MPKQYCFLCASDDGVFLDVTSDNRSVFGDQLETCLSTKVSESIELSNKICYKCAYELDQCTKFVQKYKKSHEISKPVTTSCCYLCFEEDNCIFDITKDNRAIFTPLQKIRNIFNDDLNKNNEFKLICLTCRYHLDVLYDLKRIHQETVTHLKALVNEEIDYSSFPKVYTDVVNRKTTITPFPEVTIYGVINSDSENSENMARGKRRIKNRKTNGNAQAKLQDDVKPKIRNCDECHNTVASDTDMYRFHCTGLTVCKNCWITMDPSKDKVKRQSRQAPPSLVETKSCKVFLTDVMSEGSHKSEKVYETEGDKDNQLYVISDNSSVEEDRSSASSHPNVTALKSENLAVNGKAKRGKKRQIEKNDVEEKNDGENTPLKVMKSNKESVDTNEVKSAKVTPDAEHTQQSTRRGRKRTAVSDRSSDSDISPVREPKDTLDNTDKPLSLVMKEINKRKKLKSMPEETNVRSEPSDESSNEGNLKKKVKGTSNVSAAHSSKESERSTRSRTRSSSISSTEMTSIAEFKSPKSVAPSEIKIEYSCDKCNKKFDTKLSKSEHRLTHLKQAALKLQRVAVPNVKEKQEMEVDSQEDKIPKEGETHSRTTIDKCAEELSDVAINVEDDTDEEIFPLYVKENAKKEMEKEVSNEDSNVANKSNVTKSKLRVSKRSKKVQNDEKVTKESEHCEESTGNTLNKTVPLNQIEENKNTKTSTNKDIDLEEEKDSEKTIVASENRTNLDVEEDKNSEVGKDAKISSTETEKSSECNNEKEDLEETTHDSETDKLQDISSVDTNTTKDNKDHSESYENDLENDHNDNENEMAKDVETQECDSIIECQKEDTEQPDEKEKTDDKDITDKIEMLNENKDLTDTILLDEDEVEGSEQEHDKIDENDMETEINVNFDKPNAAKDIKSDFLNGKELDIAIDGDEDEDDVALFSIDSNNDTIKYKTITDETMDATDDLGVKDKLEEEIQNLEELIESNVINDKCEAQENTYNISNNSPTDAANEILREVFDLAAAEVQKREDDFNTKSSLDTEIETLENISREIRNSADMPSLDPISVIDLDDDNDLTLN